MEQLGIKLDMRLHTTRLKQCLLYEFTDMKAQKKGQDVLLTLEDDTSPALAKVCELDSDSEAIQLAHATKIVHNHMFREAKPFTGFTEGCQKESVSSLLLALVNVIVESLTITDHYEERTPAALSIAQL